MFKRSCNRKSKLSGILTEPLNSRETAVPNWLSFFEKTHGYPGSNIGKKNLIFIFQNSNFSSDFKISRNTRHFS